MSKSRGDLVAAFDVKETPGKDLAPSWNVAPTQPINLVRERYDAPDRGRFLDTPRWGLVPFWAKDLKAGARAINARVETITDKPMFRQAALKRRGLVPADGYYEWMKNADGSKTPIYLHPENDGSLLALASLYEFWPDPAKDEDDPEKWVMSATIITREATDVLGHVHERCPVIIPESFQKDWLSTDLADKAVVRDLLAALPEPHLVPTDVGPEVGPVRNNGPELIEAVHA